MLQMFRSPKQHMALGSVLLYPIKDSFLQHNTPQGPTSVSWRFSSRVTPPWSVLPPLHLLYLPPLDWLQSKSWIYLVVLFLMHLSPSTKRQICWEQVLFQTCLCISSAWWWWQILWLEWSLLELSKHPGLLLLVDPWCSEVEGTKIPLPNCS